MKEFTKLEGNRSFEKRIFLFVWHRFFCEEQLIPDFSTKPDRPAAIRDQEEKKKVSLRPGMITEE